MNLQRKEEILLNSKFENKSMRNFIYSICTQFIMIIKEKLKKKNEKFKRKKIDKKRKNDDLQTLIHLKTHQKIQKFHLTLKMFHLMHLNGLELLLYLLQIDSEVVRICILSKLLMIKSNTIIRIKTNLFCKMNLKLKSLWQCN